MFSELIEAFSQNDKSAEIHELQVQISEMQHQADNCDKEYVKQIVGKLKRLREKYDNLLSSV